MFEYLPKKIFYLFAAKLRDENLIDSLIAQPISNNKINYFTILVRSLTAKGYSNLLCRSRTELDLLDQSAVYAFLKAEKPVYIFLAAAIPQSIVFRQRCIDILSQRNHNSKTSSSSSCILMEEKGVHIISDFSTLSLKEGMLLYLLLNLYIRRKHRREI